MPNIMTIVPEQAKGLRKLFFRWVRGQYGGILALALHPLWKGDLLERDFVA